MDFLRKKKHLWNNSSNLLPLIGRAVSEYSKIIEEVESNILESAQWCFFLRKIDIGIFIDIHWNGCFYTGIISLTKYAVSYCSQSLTDMFITVELR